MVDSEQGMSLRCGYRFLLTAAEAYPALEAAFLAAKTEIWASFLVFDPSTGLRSADGLAVGQTWFDLIVHTLQRGVRLNMVISDFDPIGAPRLHRATWRSLRMLIAAAEVAGSDRLKVTAALHPGEASLPYCNGAGSTAPPQGEEMAFFAFRTASAGGRPGHAAPCARSWSGSYAAAGFIAGRSVLALHAPPEDGRL
jgi:hypothetical protein